ncbi:hypothetical protein J3486_03965 [Streptomyces sp. VRA16 Mangrove soil]|nr:hypothetical protein [Streptomyces sp. VRA16 Mangrove soil]
MALGIGVPALAGAARSGSGPDEATVSAAAAPGSELPGKELPDTPVGAQLGGSWTSLLDESDALSMLRLDIPVSARTGDAVPFTVGKAGVLCTGEARITSHKERYVTVADAKVTRTTPTTASPASCRPDAITLEGMDGTVMWRASSKMSIQIDRASGPASTVPAALVGTWRDGDETVRIAKGRIGDAVVTGTRTDAGRRCTWSATLMDTAPFQSDPSTHPIAVAPALSTTPGCKAPYAAYRFHVENGELVRWTMASSHKDRFTRAG